MSEQITLVEAERDYDYVGKREVVRIRWKRTNDRHWRKVLVIPNEDQTIGEIMNRRREIAEQADSERPA